MPDKLFDAGPLPSIGIEIDELPRPGNVEAGVKEKLLQLGYTDEKVNDLIDRYHQIAINLVIEDQKIVRLCQLLTDNGCQTIESCEGHGNQLPCVYFVPKTNKDLENLTNIVTRYSYAKNFTWQIAVNAFPGSSPSLRYVLEPSMQKGPIVLPQDYGKLVEDLDILAISIMEYSDK